MDAIRNRGRYFGAFEGREKTTRNPVELTISTAENILRIRITDKCGIPFSCLSCAGEHRNVSPTLLFFARQRSINSPIFWTRVQCKDEEPKIGQGWVQVKVAMLHQRRIRR